MKKVIIKQNNYNKLFHITGMTKFFGCQCFGDCSCGDDFKSEPIDFYQVKRNGKKTTNHDSLHEALIRWDFINALNK